MPKKYTFTLKTYVGVVSHWQLLFDSDIHMIGQVPPLATRLLERCHAR